MVLLTELLIRLFVRDCQNTKDPQVRARYGRMGKRTTVYYCHPYTPSERGTNENQNGLIRRLVPKGTDLATLSPQEVKAAEAWLNSYPRKTFGFLCSEQLFREELALILAR